MFEREDFRGRGTTKRESDQNLCWQAERRVNKNKNSELEGVSNQAIKRGNNANKGRGEVIFFGGGG